MKNNNKSSWTIMKITMERKYWIILFIALLLWPCTFLLLFFDSESNVGDIGKFGDMFGAVNALFSGFAFIGIIISIRMQSKELKLQRKELSQTRKELKLQREELQETREEFKLQNKTLILQRFENTFFQMINLHHEIIEKMKDGDKTAREVLIQMNTNLNNLLLESIRNAEGIKRLENIMFPVENQKLTKDEIDKLISDTYLDFYKGCEDILSHYFRNLYHIFKFIHITDFINDGEKKFYASLVRSQLSHSELYLIYFNSMIEDLGKPKFLFLIKRFDIMQSLGKHEIKEIKYAEEIFQELIDGVDESVLN